MRAALIISIIICLATSAGLAERASMDDILYKVGPRYPHRFQRARIGGAGVFRLTLDSGTGKVRSVAVVKSTGTEELDREAIFALRQWRFKPGKVRPVDIPISFHSGPEPFVVPPGAIVTPNR